MKEFFYYIELPKEVIDRIKGVSFPKDENTAKIGYADLVYMRVRHVNFEGEDSDGELICNKKIADDLLEVFKELYENRYPIEKLRLIDEYGADDESSMSDNNSSAFNYRNIYGTEILSNHSMGMAIDINPLYNPYISYHGKKTVIQPANSVDYVDREKVFPHKIDHEDLCYKVFIKHGFTWGGDWTHSLDYQHFEKTAEV